MPITSRSLQRQFILSSSSFCQLSVIIAFFVRTKLLAIDQTGDVFLHPTASLFGTFHDSITKNSALLYSFHQERRVVIRLHRKAFGRPLLVETLWHVFDTPNRLFFQYFRYCSTPSIQFLDTPNGLSYNSYISTSFPLFLFPFSFSLLYLEIFF